MEDDETIGLHLRSPTNGAALGGLDAVLAIVDNDEPPAFGALRFSSATYSAGETSGSAMITVTRVGGSEGAVGLSYATGPGGTASAGTDYTSTSGTLSFVAGDTSETFSVAVLDDAGDEPNEIVTLGLSAPTGGAVVGSPSSATLTIVDDDVPPDTTAPSSTITRPARGQTYKRAR